MKADSTSNKRIKLWRNKTRFYKRIFIFSGPLKYQIKGVTTEGFTSETRENENENENDIANDIQKRKRYR